MRTSSSSSSSSLLTGSRISGDDDDDDDDADADEKECEPWITHSPCKEWSIFIFMSERMCWRQVTKQSTTTTSSLCNAHANKHTSLPSPSLSHTWLPVQTYLPR